MYVVISHHYVIAEQLQVGQQALTEMHEAMKNYEGFIKRHNLTADDNSLHITSVTYWQNKIHAQAWDDGSDRARIRGYSSASWTEPPYRTGFPQFE